MELLVHRARVARVLEVARGVALRALLPTHVGEAQARVLPLPAEAFGLVPPRLLRSGPVLLSLARLLLVLVFLRLRSCKFVTLRKVIFKRMSEFTPALPCNLGLSPLYN
eukprot:scaffold4837_cov121-Isochrysis_galbana.AAC.3